MTTLELAEKIALAVIWAPDHKEAQAVLRCLHDNGAWFCRVQTEDTPDGLLDVGSTPYEQQELFR